MSTPVNMRRALPCASSMRTTCSPVYNYKIDYNYTLIIGVYNYWGRLRYAHHLLACDVCVCVCVCVCV